MTEETMKELLFSLAWYDCSCYHNSNTRQILKQQFPETDFTSILIEFEKFRTMPPNEGCPR